MAQSAEEWLDFEYVGEITVTVQYSKALINFPAEDNTIYLALSKDRSKAAFVNVHKGKYAFLAWKEQSTDGGFVERNYTLTDGKVGISPLIADGDKATDTLVFDLYKRRLTQN